MNLKTIARGTPGFSGADLANLINEAALMAARRNKRMVTQAEFEDAKDKVMMGAERKSLVMTEEEKLLTAYHEGGHAILALNVVATDPVHKATIIPRGRALGMVMQLPERDKLSMSYEQMTSRLIIMMGGRVAEEMIFGKDKVTSGAQSDIEQATRLARMMVTRWGFSPELGAVSYGENQDEVFLGMSVARTQNVSEATAQKIDSEIRRLVEEGHNEARKILEAKRGDLETLAKGLLEFETLSGDEIVDLLAGSPVFAPHVHLPLQHASDAVLRAMGRPYTLAYYAALVSEIRARVPGASIGSDVIVGFPGESDTDFGATLRLAEELGFDDSYCFLYSARPGTPAAALEKTRQSFIDAAK